jgi:hypothetical protein
LVGELRRVPARKVAKIPHLMPAEAVANLDQAEADSVSAAEPAASDWSEPQRGWMDRWLENLRGWKE